MRTIKLTSAKYLQNYEIKLLFEDGKEVIVDFYSFLNKSGNPEIKNYLNLEKFKNFKLENGDLMWGDFELLFPIQDLYDGKISA